MRRLVVMAAFLVLTLAAVIPALPSDADTLTVDELAATPGFTEQDADVFRLYSAFFDRLPDIDGARYWLRVRRKGASLDTIAASFADSDEFRQRYGAPSEEEYLRILYRNVLGRTPDAEGFNYWLGLLRSGELNRGSVVRWVAANPEFVAREPHPASPRDGAGTPVVADEMFGLAIPRRLAPPFCGGDFSGDANVIREVGPSLIADVDGDGIGDGVAVLRCEPAIETTGAVESDYATGVVLLRGSDRSLVYSLSGLPELTGGEDRRRNFNLKNYDLSHPPSLQTDGRVQVLGRNLRLALSFPDEPLEGEEFIPSASHSYTAVDLTLTADGFMPSLNWPTIVNPTDTTARIVEAINAGDAHALSAVIAFDDLGTESADNIVERFASIGTDGPCTRPNPNGTEVNCPLREGKRPVIVTLTEVSPDRWLLWQLVERPEER